MSLAAAPAPCEPTSLRRFFRLDLLDNRYPALHGMRALAIVSVVQYHVTMSLTFARGLPLDREWVGRSMAVFFGMDLFFVLSGFLIGSILLHSVESSGSAHVRRFYLRRAFRTFPPYYFVLTALVLLTPLTAAQKHHLWLEYVYLTNYGLPLLPGDLVMPWGWSLALEEQFYLTVPVLFLVLYKVRSDRARLTILGAIWISALVVRLVLYFRNPQWDESALYNFVYYRTHTRFDTLVAGILLAYVQNRWGASIARWLELPFARATLALPSLACLYVLMQPWMFGPAAVGLVHVFSWGTLTTLMYFAWTLLLLNGGDGWVRRALSLSVFRQVATLGYGVYLVHLPLCEYVVSHAAQWLIADRRWPVHVVWVAAVGALLLLSLLVSYVLHLAIEKPSLRLRDRYAA
jgi:peptidoglycan/LPS O-acetylase OafA/YrhL